MEVDALSRFYSLGQILRAMEEADLRLWPYQIFAMFKHVNYFRKKAHCKMFHRQLISPLHCGVYGINLSNKILIDLDLSHAWAFFLLISFFLILVIKTLGKYANSIFNYSKEINFWWEKFLRILQISPLTREIKSSRKKSFFLRFAKLNHYEKICTKP